MTDELRIRLDWVPPVGMNINAHTHWRRKHPDEQNAHMIGKSAVHGTRYTAADLPDMPVLVVVIRWEKGSRRKDSDNALNCVKHLIDGICAGLGIDDKRFLTSMALQGVDPAKKGYTEVHIRPATKTERRLAA